MKVFIANRTDGFGARLANILLTMVLAERHGALFKFTWNTAIKEFHALDRAENIFDAEFLHKHLAILPRGWRHGGAYSSINPGEDLSDEAIIRQIDQASLGVVISRDDDPSQLLERFSSVRSNPFAEAFSRIRFTERLEKIRNAAQAAPLPENPTALHLRSGDIIFGNYRLDTGFENKLITLPMAKVIIQDGLASRSQPILFGQDERSCQKLAASFSLQTVDQIFDLSSMNRTERALFELVILSRLQRINAGTSAFTGVPSLIAGVPVYDPSLRVSYEKMSKLILDNVVTFEENQDYPRLQVAYSYRSAFHYGREKLSREDAILALDGAIRNDPRNVLYRFQKAAYLFTHREMLAGDEQLRAAFELDSQGADLGKCPASEFLTRRNADGTLRCAPILAELSGAASLGMPYANLSLAIACQRLGDYPRGLSYLKTARMTDRDNLLLKSYARSMWVDFLTPRGMFYFARYRLTKRR